MKVMERNGILTKIEFSNSEFKRISNPSPEIIKNKNNFLKEVAEFKKNVEREDLGNGIVRITLKKHTKREQ